MTEAIGRISESIVHHGTTFILDRLCKLLESRASSARAHLFRVHSHPKPVVENTHIFRGTVSPKSHRQTELLANTRDKWWDTDASLQ